MGKAVSVSVCGGGFASRHLQVRRSGGRRARVRGGGRSLFGAAEWRARGPGRRRRGALEGGFAVLVVLSLGRRHIEKRERVEREREREKMKAFFFFFRFFRLFLNRILLLGASIGRKIYVGFFWR